MLCFDLHIIGSISLVNAFMIGPATPLVTKGIHNHRPTFGSKPSHDSSILPTTLPFRHHNKRVIMSPLYDTPPDDYNYDNTLDTSIEKATAEAQSLKDLAQKTRLEAEKMSVELTLEKIQGLEQQLDNNQMYSNNNPMSNLDEENIKDQIKMLKQQLGQDSGDNNRPSSTRISSRNTRRMPMSRTSSSTQQQEQEQLESTFQPATATMIRENDTKLNSYTTIPNNISPISQEELETRIKAYKSFPPELQQRFANVVGVNDITDASTIMNRIYTQQQINAQLRKEAMDTSPNPENIELEMTPVDWVTAEAGYWKLPQPIKFMVASSVGLDGFNETAVIEKLLEKNMVQPSVDGVEFFLDGQNQQDTTGGDMDTISFETDSTIDTTSKNITADQISEGTIFFDSLPQPMQTMLARSVNMTYPGDNSTTIIETLVMKDKFTVTEDGHIAMELALLDDDDENADVTPESNYVKSLFPQVTRKFGYKPSKEDMDTLFTKVLGRNTFNPTQKPESIIGGYIIQGENRKKSSDELMSAINEELIKMDLAERLRVYYVRDPNPITEEQVEYDMVEVPVLMVTGADLSPETIPILKQVVSVSGLLAVAAYSVGSAPLDTSNIDLGVIDTAIVPLFLAMLVPQIVHELAHQIVAFKDKFKAGLPTLVPSILTGIQGCITPIITPPKNLNSLFDFSIAGPISGMIASVLLLYTGLEKQVFMDAIYQSQLPSLPLILVKSSSLGSGMVEWLLGNGVLLSPDPFDMIKLHPFAIAGIFGIISNALSLLPLGNTDGGRIATTLFGRSFATLLSTLTLFALAAFGLFGGDESNILLFYALFIFFFQREPEIPCENEVDAIDDFRALVAFGTAVLVGLSLVPMM